MREIYSPLYLLETPFVVTDVESAEMIKYASNGFLAVKISFINEIARLCELVGADVHAVAKGMGLDKRIGAKFLHPGPGFGGSCFPKDTRRPPIWRGDSATRFEIIEAAITVNDATKSRMIAKIAAAGPLAGKTVAVLGISFKPETDDMRESPALRVMDLQRRREGPGVRSGGNGQCPRAPPGRALREDAYDCAEGADVLVLATEWNEFRALDFARLAGLLRARTIIDLRNVYDAGDDAAGWEYAASAAAAHGRRDRCECSSPGAPASSAATSASVCSPRATTSSRWTIS